MVSLAINEGTDRVGFSVKQRKLWWLRTSVLEAMVRVLNKLGEIIMNNVQMKAMEIAKKVSVKFEAEFGFKPIIGGSLSLILGGYTPNRYINNLCINDVDLEIPFDMYVEWIARIPKFNGNVEELSSNKFNVAAIDKFINKFRIEGYCSIEHYDLGEHPHWYWLGDVKVSNPMIALKAKSEYVINGLNGFASNEEYQGRRNKRLLKHYNDIINATKSITDWHIPPIVNTIATLKSVRDSVKQYNTPHDFSKGCDCVMCRLNDSEGWNYEDASYMMGLGLNIKKVLGVE